MAITLPQRTKENVVVNVDDALDQLTSLDATTPQYSVRKPDPDDTDQIAWTSAVPSGMKLYCMIDTNTPSLWAAGTYRLYTRFTTAPELPVLGPYEIEISDA